MMCFTFQEFLKKEFSHENIYFWTACERYRKIKGDDEDSVKVRMAAAENIIKRHLSSGAPEPVNVDSHARQAAQEGPPTSHLFATAQKQIYNLMKFDSFRYVLMFNCFIYRIVVHKCGQKSILAEIKLFSCQIHNPPSVNGTGVECDLVT